MNTYFTHSLDGTPVAYDRVGAGPAVMLLHGGGGKRQDWQEAGYVERLSAHFTVITVDLRGHGESGLPTRPEDYTIDKMCQDFLAAADACEAEHFTVWGMSFGGKIGRYLAAGYPTPAQSRRVTRMVLMGTPLGPSVTGQLRQEAVDFCAHWPPIAQAQQQGTLDIATLSQYDQEFLRNFKVPVMLGWVRAMLGWPDVEPRGFRCPTLWLVGSQDAPAIDSLEVYQSCLEGSRLQVQVLEGLDHMQVFEQIDRVYPLMLEFTHA
jgi:pimeloyl-ACP methyl ester carboxylesterase